MTVIGGHAVPEVVVGLGDVASEERPAFGALLAGCVPVGLDGQPAAFDVLLAIDDLAVDGPLDHFTIDLAGLIDDLAADLARGEVPDALAAGLVLGEFPLAGLATFGVEDPPDAAELVVLVSWLRR